MVGIMLVLLAIGIFDWGMLLSEIAVNVGSGESRRQYSNMATRRFASVTLFALVATTFFSIASFLQSLVPPRYGENSHTESKGKEETDEEEKTDEEKEGKKTNEEETEKEVP